MESQAVLIGKRMREIRTVLEISPAEMARVTGVSEAEYLKHEAGEVDSSFSFLYHCAERFKVDISTLVEGEGPKLSFYTLTRRNGGMPIRRRHDFEYLHLASHLKNRQAEPFVVTAPWKGDDQPIALSTHTGQEFDYILSGELKVQLDDKIEIMRPGDSILYDSGHPHGMVAVGGKPCEFLAIVIRGEGEAPMAFEPEGRAAANAVSPETAEKLIYHRFVDEELDENGNLKNISYHWPENFNYAYDVIDELEKKSPDQRAMLWMSKHHEKHEFTFHDIAENSRRVANYLTLLGVKRGDRVMLVLKRHYQYWFTLLALHRIGAIALPVTNQLQAKDFEYRFKAVGVSAVVATADDGVPDHIDAAVPGTDVRTKIIVNGTRAGWHDFNSEYVRCGTDFPRNPEQKATDAMLMYFSSGTTGYPKAVLHTYTYPLGHIVTARWWQNVRPGGLHWTISDTGWGKAAWGKIYGQWLCETGLMVYDFDRFHAEDILGLFKECNITTFCAPPTMYRFFIKEDLSRFDLSGLQYACIAGEALNPEVFQQFYKATGLKLMEGFGQTESTVILANFTGMTPKPGSMGRPSPQYPVELIDRDGNPVGTGEVGEIVIRTEPMKICGLVKEYYNNPEATAEVWRDGVYHTGDTAWRDEDGYYWYVGRTDDLIKSSGYRIGPFEIESVLMELPYVLECAVVGVPDPTRGQVVKAFIVLTKDKTGSEELVKEIQEYLKHKTAPYKYPRQVEFIPEMPKTVSGKIRRSALRGESK